MSAQKVSDRTADLGQTVSRSTIADIENGRRRYITVAELLLLAYALNTTPVALTYPGPYDGTVEVLPDTRLPALAAARWFGGTLAKPPDWTDGDAYDRNRRDLKSVLEDVEQKMASELASIRDVLATTNVSIEKLAQASRSRHVLEQIAAETQSLLDRKADGG